MLHISGQPTIPLHFAVAKRAGFYIMYELPNSEDKMQLPLDPTLFFARKIKDGYSWTLVSRLGKMLRDAEKMYGPRDKEYTILGIEFVEDTPRIWYPGNCNNIAIQLDRSAMTNLNKACYQLAHECVHLLCPTGTKGASNLEEGLATYNSAYYMETEMNQPGWHGTLQSYIQAEKLVRRIMKNDPLAIKRMRQSEFNISKITVELLLKEAPSISFDEAQFLAEKFGR